MIMNMLGKCSNKMVDIPLPSLITKGYMGYIGILNPFASNKLEFRCLKKSARPYWLHSYSVHWRSLESSHDEHLATNWESIPGSGKNPETSVGFLVCRSPVRAARTSFGDAQWSLCWHHHTLLWEPCRRRGVGYWKRIPSRDGFHQMMIMVGDFNMTFGLVWNILDDMFFSTLG
jgi:hypothetical protein